MLIYEILFFSTPNLDIGSQESSGTIVVGSHVWVEDPFVSWIDGEVSKINGNQVHVHATNGNKVSSQLIEILLLCHPYYAIFASFILGLGIQT